MYAFTQIRKLPDIDLDFLQLQQREHIGDTYHILVRLQQAFTKPESFVEVFQIDASMYQNNQHTDYATSADSHSYILLI